jgi:hypothetical protein
MPSHQFRTSILHSTARNGLPQTAEARNTHNISRTQCNPLHHSTGRQRAPWHQWPVGMTKIRLEQAINIAISSSPCQLAAQDSRYCVCAIGWRKAGQWGPHERCIRRLEARWPAVITPLPGFPSPALSSPDPIPDKTMKERLAEQPRPPSPRTNTRTGFELFFCARTAANGSFDGGECALGSRLSCAEGNFPPTRMRATQPPTCIPAAGRGRDWSVDATIDSIADPPADAPPQCSVHGRARSSMPLLDVDNNVFVASC